MGISVLASLAVVATVLLTGTEAAGACPTLFNFYSHPTDCTKFYRCFWGSPIEFVCPAGTHWNQHILTCDHAYNVPCASAILDPIYKLVKNDGYGYVADNYGRNYGAQGYEKGKYAGYDSTGTRYAGSYVKANDYGNYGYGTSGYVKKTVTPSVGLNYGGYGGVRGVYGRYPQGYARGYARYPSYYGGYVAGGYGSGYSDEYASRAASGYAAGGDPVVGRVFGRSVSSVKKAYVK